MPQHKDHLTACPECDLLLQETAVPPGGESLCPRCGHVLREGRPDSVLHALLLSTLGLMFFWAGHWLALVVTLGHRAAAGVFSGTCGAGAG